MGGPRLLEADKAEISDALERGEPMGSASSLTDRSLLHAQMASTACKPERWWTATNNSSALVSGGALSAART